MSETTPAASPVRLPGPLALVRAGREAFRTVPGLKLLLIKGFVLLYGLFVLIGAGAWAVVYRYVIRPQFERLDIYRTDGGWLMDILVPVLDVLMQLVQLVMLAGVMILALLVALAMMSVWFEAVVEKIVRHCRGQAGGEAFSLRVWLGSILRSLRESLWLLVVALAAILLGFVPVAGPFLVLLLTGYLLGYEVRQPYLAVNAALGEASPLPRAKTLLTVRMGLLPVGVAIVPFVGWLALPVLVIVMVAGLAWVNERPPGGGN